MNGPGFSTACRARYASPPAASSAARIMSFSAFVLLFGMPLREPPGVRVPLCAGIIQRQFAVPPMWCRLFGSAKSRCTRAGINIPHGLVVDPVFGEFLGEPRLQQEPLGVIGVLRHDVGEQASAVFAEGHGGRRILRFG